MDIPFIRTLPGDADVVVRISRPRRIEHLAHVFLRSGGRYIMTVHPPRPGEPNVELVAVYPAPPPTNAIRVCEAHCFDDPSLPQAVDQLVIDSMERARRAMVH